MTYQYQRQQHGTVTRQCDDWYTLRSVVTFGTAMKAWVDGLPSYARSSLHEMYYSSRTVIRAGCHCPVLYVSVGLFVTEIHVYDIYWHHPSHGGNLECRSVKWVKSPRYLFCHAWHASYRKRDGIDAAESSRPRLHCPVAPSAAALWWPDRPSPDKSQDVVAAVINEEDGDRRNQFTGGPLSIGWAVPHDNNQRVIRERSTTLDAPTPRLWRQPSCWIRCLRFKEPGDELTGCAVRGVTFIGRTIHGIDDRPAVFYRATPRRDIPRQEIDSPLAQSRAIGDTTVPVSVTSRAWSCRCYTRVEADGAWKPPVVRRAVGVCANLLVDRLHCRPARPRSDSRSQ